MTRSSLAQTFKAAALILGMALLAPPGALADPCSPNPNKGIIEEIIEILRGWGLLDSGGGEAADGGGEAAQGGDQQGDGSQDDALLEAFDQVASGELPVDDAPDSIRVPQEVVDGMQDAWDDSMPGGRSQEQGGIIVEEDDQYEWKRGDAGDSGSFSPNYDDLEDGEDLVGVGHTHPYDETEGGFEDVTFSGQDLARLVFVEDDIAVVQSGESLFLAARTQEFDQMLEGLSEKDKLALFNEMKDTFDEAYGDAKGSFQDRVRAGVLAVVDEYHLLYYEGKGNTLHRVGGGD